MSELAYNQSGDPFDVPASATAWRVRRLKAKGAPEVVYGSDGLPLLLPIDAGVEELKAEVMTPGRYRLDPVGDGQRAIPDATSAYVYVQPPREVREASPGGAVSTMPLDSVVSELLQANNRALESHANLARIVIERFGGTMESASTMMRAVPPSPAPVVAPVAEPLLSHEDEGHEDDDDGEAAPTMSPAGGEVPAMLVQWGTAIAAAIFSGQIKLPSLSGLLDWRKAAPATTPAVTAQAETICACRTAASSSAGSSSTTATAAEPAPAPAEPLAAPSSGTPPKAGMAVLASLPPAAMGRLMALQQALSPQERALAMATIQELPASQLRAWADELASLSPDEALTKVRQLLASPPSQEQAS